MPEAAITNMNYEISDINLGNELCFRFSAEGKRFIVDRQDPSGYINLWEADGRFYYSGTLIMRERFRACDPSSPLEIIEEYLIEVLKLRDKLRLLR